MCYRHAGNSIRRITAGAWRMVRQNVRGLNQVHFLMTQNIDISQNDKNWIIFSIFQCIGEIEVVKNFPDVNTVEIEYKGNQFHAGNLINEKVSVTMLVSKVNRNKHNNHQMKFFGLFRQKKNRSSAGNERKGNKASIVRSVWKQRQGDIFIQCENKPFAVLFLRHMAKGQNKA